MGLFDICLVRKTKTKIVVKYFALHIKTKAYALKTVLGYICTTVPFYRIIQYIKFSNVSMVLYNVSSALIP